MAVTFNSSDLQFILDQIEIAEANAAGTPLIDLLANVTLPFGLRTVDGSLNNLVPGQSEFGAADNTFPRLGDPNFIQAQPVTFDPDGPGGQVVGDPTSYQQTSGFVFDSQPRTISNLVVDQTPNNPAAYAIAMDPGADGVLNFGIPIGAPGNDDVLKEGVQLVTSPGLDQTFGTPDDSQVFFFQNSSPDLGLSAPFNSWFTFFGQFFDHGLDLVTKGGNGFIFIPLQPDDPLFNPGPDGIPNTGDDGPNFMVETRATMLPGPDGILGTADDIHEQQNTTTPFVDQNQTYTSSPSHQVFLREYATGPDGESHATGRLITNRNLGGDGKFGTDDDTDLGGMATWAVVKAQARDLLGIDLTDADVGNVPLLATDDYGNYLRGAHGLPQVIVDVAETLNGATTHSLHKLEGVLDGVGLDLQHPPIPADVTQNPDATYAVTVLRTGHQFLIDMAAAANPFDPIDGHFLTPDADLTIGDHNAPPTPGFYDNELLDAHYIAGDGRANENIGLTAVHNIFHSEHNRLVDQTKAVLVTAVLTDPAAATNPTASLALLNAYLDPLHQVTTLPTVPPGLDLNNVTAVNAFVDGLPLVWDGERLFQAARFGTEMQYQHLVFEEFARTLVPSVDEFLAPNGYDVTIDPSIFAEFAHAVFRLGHSMLPETIDRLTFDFHVVPDLATATTAPDQQLGLIGAFLNPLEFVASGPTADAATGAIVRGLTREPGNAIDEFVTDAVRNNLLGTPLDLAALNIARGRDTGLPSLNAARRAFYSMTSQDQVAGDSSLTPYTSWADYAAHLKHPESIVNFIAAYGTHALIAAETTLEGKRAAAAAIVFGESVTLADGRVIAAPTDGADFLHSTGAWASTAGADGIAHTVDDVTITGLDAVDLWVGGLAEAITPFGSMLGPTFQFVFETQLENLQNGDRFYYLDRTAGTHFGIELEMNSFAKLIMANTDATHLPAQVFSTPAWILEVDQSKQFTGLNDATHTGNADPTFADDQPGAGQSTVLASFNNPTIINGVEIAPLVIRDNPDTPVLDTNYLHYTGNSPVVLGGTEGNDFLIAGASDQDTVYGDGGNDTLNGGAGDDNVFGGAGDDIIFSGGGTDTLDGGAGNDVIIESHSNLPMDIPNLMLGGAGQDFFVTSDDINQIFGGSGDDFILAGISELIGQGARNNLPEEGDEGNDWIEEGTQDGAPGDTGAFAQPDPLTFDAVPGNDIFVGGEGFDEMIGEGGDDIFVGSGAQDKMDGMSGFDWTTYKNDLFGVTVDMRLPLFAPAHGLPFAPGAVQPVGQSPDSILDRFAEVEGLSGSKGNDILIGDDQTADIIANITARGSVLTNISLINGLQDLLDHFFGFDTASSNHVTSFGAGNIILGGDGSDIITGNDGDDLIDGDKWLNVRISVRAGIDPNTGLATGPEIASFDSMKDLVPFMRDGIYNPGQLVAVREILNGSAPSFDTAEYNQPLNDPVTNLPNYIINIDDGGTPNDFSDDIVTVRDVSAKPLDGTDRLTHIERLQFADQSIVLVPGLNNEPTGHLAILDGVTNTPDDTPTEGQLLRVTLGDVVDLDSPNGIHNATFVWQQEVGAGTGVFTDIILKPGRIGVGFPTADGSTFTVDPALALGGLALRVRAVYEDDHGVTEQVFSTPTQPVVAVPVPPATLPTFVDHTQTHQGVGVQFIRSDLDFILDQIKIAERNSAGEDLVNILPNVRVPFGLRTVDGSDNNLINFGNPQPGLTSSDQTHFGAADQVFPRLTDPVFRSAEAGTSYAQTSGLVIDSQPRTISNLIVDQTPNNPAAYASAMDPGVDGVLNFGIPIGTPGNDDVLKDGVQLVTSPGLDGKFGTVDDTPVFFFPNVKPDAGVSSPFDAWFTFFGQFFDHGLDLVTKGGNGTIFVPLNPDDPLYVPGSPTNFMVETRATMLPGPDGILGTPDDIHENSNTTTPFVDQNQTYTSHPSHQVFLRAYAVGVDGQPHATGKLIENRDLGADGHFGGTGANADTIIGGMATWAVVKAQARDLLGINLTDKDFDNVPLLATDPYGNYLRGAHGLPQVVMQTAGADGIFGTSDDGTTLVEGNLAAPLDLMHAVRTGHQFLIDVAHNAVPVVNAAGVLQPDADTGIGNPQPTDAFGNNLTYDDELLNAHYIAGDGRVNENIGLTSVHAIFHSEHNRLVDQIKQTVLIAEGDTPGYIKDWVTPGFVFTPGMTVDQIDWNGERLFQAAKFGTEMQYQHLVFEEFARTVQPLVDPFFAPTQVYDTKINPAIEAEFAHTVYRFGHSMLTETVDRFDPNFNVVGDPNSANPDQQLGLIAAFLNPLAYAESGPTPAEATGAIVRGVTRTVGNQIDEFVTEALRNNLLGTPLDLAVLNIARGRDTGIPSLNEARREFYADISDPDLKPYTSWADFMQHIKHPESLVNFIAAYGTHHLITDETTLEGQRAAAFAIVTGSAVTLADGRVIDAPTDRLDFLNSTGAWANTLGPDGHAGTADDVTITGLDAVDFWIGGLAEEVTPFGGLLGSTFNFVFENQLEKLQDGDRFYYLERTAGMNFNAELEANTFAKLVEANTDATHLPALIFSAAEFTLEVDPTKQFNADVMLPGLDGDLGTPDDVSAPRSDPVNTGPFASLIPLVDRDNPATADPDTNYLKFNGTDATVEVVLGGTDPGNAHNPSGNDILIAGPGDDSVYGDGGNDRIEGGAGNDHLLGGAGDDIISDSGGDDVIEGMDGNDVIQAGGGANILLGGFGQDFIIAGEDASEVFGGPGNDFLFGTKGDEFSFGNEGDDWIERGTSDGAAGDNFDPFGNEPVKGNDVFKGDGGPDNVDGEGGDDVYIATPSESDRFIGFGGFDWATFKDDPVGVTVGLDSSLRFFDQPQVPGSSSSIISRMDLVEGLSGSRHDDFLYGDDSDAARIAVAGVPPTGSLLLNPSLIDGLQKFLDDVLHFNLVPPGGGGPVLPTGDLFTVDGTGVAHISQFGTGNIILGGEGSDIIMGQGGDDLIDGDAWLNVRISVRSLADHNVEITSADSMIDLIPAMMAGIYNPSQLQIVRELRYSATPDFDTAQFDGPLANYTFTLNGVAVDPAALLGAGGEDIITVTDNAAGGGVKTEGTDTLRHIERLQFSDQALVLGGLNHQPVGSLTISDANPTEDELLTVSIAGVTDADNKSATNPTGAITGTVSYFWQGELSPGVFQDIMFFGAGETQRAVGTSFTPTEPFVGGINFASLTGVRLRVRAVYQDGNGVLEQVFSDPSAPVANVNDPPVGTVALSDVTPTATELITATPVITDADGMTTSVFGYQWQQSATGAANSWTDIAGAEGPVFAPTNDQAGLHLRVVVTYVDDHGTTEQVFSEATQPVGAALVGTALANTMTGTVGNDLISGLGGSDTLNGLAGNDTIDGGTGNDTINGGAGDDVLIGGAGNDTITGDVGNDTITGGLGTDIINAGAGDDLINYGLGDGADTIIGDTGADTLKIVGTGDADTLDVIYNGTVLTGIEGGTLSGVETVMADLAGGNDTLSYGVGTTAGVVVNLASHTASGFASIEGIENVTGGSGGDLLSGNADGNILSGGAGNDTLIGGLGVDTLIGGTGVDTASYAGETDAMFVNLATGTTERGSAANPVEDVLTTIENVVGGTGSDSLTGNTAANLLDGGAGAGNDTLLGGSGNDTLLGGGGDDQLVGGVGNDSISGGDGNDVITYNFGDGTDVLVDGGNGVADGLNILGTAANNTLSVTWTGSTFTAVTGIQLISGIETFNADLAGGTDTLSYAGAVSGISVDLGSNSASGFASIAGIENVTGGAGDDTLAGGNGANVLAGGAGNDSYVVGAGDTVTENAGGGTDTVNSSVSFTLGANVENLNLTATTASNGTGNGSVNIIVDLAGGNNVLSGQNGTDTLDGGAGKDTLDGGGGNDVIIGGADDDRMTGGGNGDTFVFAHGFGHDVITDFDANGNGTLASQDLIDLTTYGSSGGDPNITALNFNAHVAIAALAGNTTVTIDGNTILLQGVGGGGNNAITITDFLLFH